jgi:hypothetical protein
VNNVTLIVPKKSVFWNASGTVALQDVLYRLLGAGRKPWACALQRTSMNKFRTFIAGSLTAPTAFLLVPGTSVRSYCLEPGPGSVVPAASVHSGQGSRLQTAFWISGLQPNDLTASPSTISAGQYSTCSVTLDGVASTNTPVAVSTNHAEAFSVMPSSVTVLAGQSSASFQVEGGRVSTTTLATVSANLNGGVASANISVLQ